jgi:ABC-type phosphate transport system substrate-binding protein
MMNIIKKISVISLLNLGVVMPGFAEVAVIVNVDNTASIDQTQIRNIFLGKVKTFPNGVSARPVDIAVGDPARAEFIKKVLRKDEANLNAHWARMLFSSKGRPPQEVADADAVIEAVSSNKSAIGYIDAKDVTSAVKVVTVFK